MINAITEANTTTNSCVCIGLAAGIGLIFFQYICYLYIGRNPYRYNSTDN